MRVVELELDLHLSVERLGLCAALQYALARALHHELLVDAARDLSYSCRSWQPFSMFSGNSQIACLGREVPINMQFAVLMDRRRMYISNPLQKTLVSSKRSTLVGCLAKVF